MSPKVLGVINIIIAILNGIIIFMPKKPVSGIHSNAAGGLIIFGLGMLIVLVLHVILLSVGLYYQKTTLLRVITFIIIPISVLFWYFMFPLTTF